MPSYHYIALNQAQQELSGVIEAPDETFARQKLNGLGLSVVSINAFLDGIKHTEPHEGKTTYEFEALDKNGKKIIGTIVSDDPAKAYAKLFEEYKLNVLSFFAASLSQEDKKQARKLGVLSLHKQYEKLYGKKSKSEGEKELAENALQTKQQLLEKVDYTISRIDVFLKESSGELKPEEKDAIQSYINQLIRIKDSTNLEHIRTTCEKMLEHIQKQELFIHEEQKIRESAKLKVETKELLDQLKGTAGLHQEIDLVSLANRYKNNALIRPLANFILKTFEIKDPEIKKKTQELAAARKHIWTYLRMLFLGQTKILRMEAYESIKTLLGEIKRLKLEIKALKMKAREKNAAETDTENGLFENIASLIGWMLAFYLISYVFSYPFTIKNLPSLRLPRSFYFYSSYLTKGLTLFLFLAYCAITAKNFWLKNRPPAAFAVYFACFLGFLLIAINLM